jgi:hypothetical protein
MVQYFGFRFGLACQHLMLHSHIPWNDGFLRHFGRHAPQVRVCSVLISLDMCWRSILLRISFRVGSLILIILLLIVRV